MASLCLPYYFIWNLTNKNLCITLFVDPSCLQATITGLRHMDLQSAE